MTLGDPRGIGAEVARAAMARSDVRDAASFVVIGASGGTDPVDVSIGDWTYGVGQGIDDRVLVAEAGRLAGVAIESAVRMALDGEVDGIVTAPVDKAALMAGGFLFPGHTEMLAALTAREVTMMLTAEGTSPAPLRVSLVTTHLALRDVPAAVTREAVVAAASRTRSALHDWFGIDSPRIALCALNPHAGEGGAFGSEELEVLGPAARDAGLVGPHPADTVFVRALRGEFDAVVTPYHDVGMTAIKVASFGSAVNVTLGLPFPRTSPDHGTAMDIAGKGRADPSSMAEAMLLCARLAGRVRPD